MDLSKPVGAPVQISGFRRFLPQFLATTALNFIVCAFGITIVYSSIVIPSILGMSDKLNPDETIRMTAEEASWLTSVSSVGQPFGCVLSGYFAESLGRKKSLLLATFPFIGAWLMLAYTSSPIVLYIGFALLGFGDGLIAVPCMSFVNEISEPSVRGILISSTGLLSNSAILMMFTFGTFLSWRQVSLICAIFPITAFITMIFIVKETPVWLVSQKRTGDALKSLQWYRGWVPPQNVIAELDSLQRYCSRTKSCENCQKLNMKCIHVNDDVEPTLCDKLKAMSQRRMLRPIVLILAMTAFMQFSGMSVMRPYIIPILTAFNTPVDAYMVTVYLGLLGICASGCLIFSIRFLGKRKIHLYSTFIATLACLALSAYAFTFFPLGWSSLEEVANNSTAAVQHQEPDTNDWSYFALAAFLVAHFFTSLGVTAIPMIVIAELLPLKSRCFYAVLMGILFQLIALFSTKTYYDLEMWLSTAGATLFYGILGTISLISMYFLMPETEGRSSEDIELHFSNKNHRWTNTNIHINRL